MSAHDDGMADGTVMSIEEYLNTSFHPDCDYVDGKVQERLWGEFSHSRTMTETLFLPGNPITQCVLVEETPDQQVITFPLLLCIEILSPEDRIIRFMDKLADYFKMDVPVCWVIDPIGHRGWAPTHKVLTEATDGILRAGDIKMPLAEVLE
jgi:hypothetical protein